MPTITSRQNPIVARYRAAARGESRGSILIDGAHLIVDALAAGIPIFEAAVATAPAESGALTDVLSRLERAGVDVSVVAAPVMDALSPVRTSTGIVALAERPTPDESSLYAAPDPVVMIAMDIQDPGNLGAIVRVAEAAGATGVVAAGACADPYSWKALRGSMGSALRLPVIPAPNGDGAVETARRHGCRIISTVPRGGRSLYEARLEGPLAILIGSEGAGIDQVLIDQADERVTIPMRPPVESLNTAVAAALVLYEAHRRRH